jgi:hypothetical protein
MSEELLSKMHARRIIVKVNSQLERQFVSVVELLNTDATLRPALRGGKSHLTSAEYLEALANQFALARAPRVPQEPKTIPDPVVGTILSGYYGVSDHDLGGIAHTHLLSMAAENQIGDLLERYVASKLEPVGWIWCSGSVVKSVDFIRPQTSGQPLILLQVKNRDNSENSSSSAIRGGTAIQKWFRSFSRRRATNWDAFPDATAKKLLSEQGFSSYVRERMTSLRSGKPAI